MTYACFFLVHGEPVAMETLKKEEREKMAEKLNVRAVAQLGYEKNVCKLPHVQ